MIIIDAPFASWESTVASTRLLMKQGVDVVWCSGKREPIVFLSAMSQLVPKVRLGLFASSLAGRPPLYAARQLMTLDELSGGRVEVAIDDEQVFDDIARACKSLEVTWVIDGKSPRRARFSAVR